MADGLMYPTGISSTPIDVTSGAKAFMQSAIESRLDEIRANTQQISENKKNILNAMSIKALPELANAQRDRYQQQIEDYRKSLVDKFRESGGKLTMQQQREIQDGFIDLNSRMQNEVNQLKQFESYQALTRDPNFVYAYDTNKAEQVLGNAYSRMMKGEGLGNIAAEWASAQIPPTIGDYTEKRYGNEIKRMDISTKGYWKDANTFVFNTQEAEDEVNRTIDHALATDPFYKQESKVWRRSH